ncbi:hypothetical protein PRZ48_003459 [Zasmidium cellare]|uniref:Uncharacterized protein n=1 Tax=Zasmidium cellare TaxID=395010 RepID=A0ABR0EWC9_ZASCE|nr:hypothetical protein PRZ48_003459 [Zasmidium cellare]
MTEEKGPKLHWKVPTTISAAFAGGLSFAIGHHLFYASLAGTSVNDGAFDQQQNLAIGNAFAFLIRAALAISIGATYWQLFWRTLLDKSFPLETADALASLLGSINDMLSPKAWLASPPLVFIAAVAWLIPLATIIPPATLTVRIDGHTEYNLMALRTPDFLGTTMAENILQENDDGGMAMSIPSGTDVWHAYHGPANDLARVVTSAALDGELPKLPSPAVNASYVLSFPAPSVRCEEMPVSVLSNWAPVMGCDPGLPFEGSANNFTACYDNELGDYWWPYLAWAPSTDSIVPFPNGSLSSGNSSDSPPSPGDLPLSSITGFGRSGYLGSYNSSAANLFLTAAQTSEPETGSGDLTWFPLNCSLYNSSYTVNFTFQEDTQTVSVLDVEIASPIAPLFSTSIRVDAGYVPEKSNVTMNYQALMDTLGRLLIGDITPDGTVYQTQILRTELAFTKELWPVYNSSGFNISEATASQWYQKPLAAAVEDLFQNMTLSLFGRSEYLSVYNDQHTNVTLTSLRNVYTYNWQRLWLAYGLALGFALVVVIIGCGSLASARASYSNKLSTILRVTGGDRLDVHVKELDRAGQDPLPEYMGKAKLLLYRARREAPEKNESSLETLSSIPPRKPVATETSAMIQRPGSPMEDA